MNFGKAPLTLEENGQCSRCGTTYVRFYRQGNVRIAAGPCPGCDTRSGLVPTAHVNAADDLDVRPVVLEDERVAAGTESRSSMTRLRVRRKLDEHLIPALRATKRPVLAMDGGQVGPPPGGENLLRPR